MVLVASPDRLSLQVPAVNFSKRRVGVVGQSRLETRDSELDVILCNPRELWTTYGLRLFMSFLDLV